MLSIVSINSLAGERERKDGREEKEEEGEGMGKRRGRRTRNIGKGYNKMPFSTLLL